MSASKSVGIFGLTLFITGAIDTIRNLPAIAIHGGDLLIYVFLAAFFFLIPAALITAECSSYSKTHGGVYFWVKSAFNDKLGFLAIWLQWVNTVVWFPTILSFIISAGLYVINPRLIHHTFLLVVLIISTFWIITLLNFKGVSTSVKLSAFCTIIGILIPLVLLISLTIVLLVKHPLIITSHFQVPTLGMALKKLNNWTTVTGIITAFVGIELAAVHIKYIDNPKLKFPVALSLAVILILSTLIMGSLSITLLIPSLKISLTAGVVQSFAVLFKQFHMIAFLPVLSLLMVLGGLGGMLSWVISPVAGLLDTAAIHKIPHFLTVKNKQGVYSNFLVFQALVVSGLCLVYFFFPTINACYWFLTSLSTQLYMLMYILLFLSAIKLKYYKHILLSQGFSIPGKWKGTLLVSCIGLIGCIATFTIGFLLPSHIHFSQFIYSLFSCIGLFILILPGYYISSK